MCKETLAKHACQGTVLGALACEFRANPIGFPWHAWCEGLRAKEAQCEFIPVRSKRKKQPQFCLGKHTWLFFRANSCEALLRTVKSKCAGMVASSSKQKGLNFKRRETCFQCDWVVCNPLIFWSVFVMDQELFYLSNKRYKNQKVKEKVNTR